MFPGVSDFIVLELLVGHDMKLIQDEIDIFKLQVVNEGCFQVSITIFNHIEVVTYRAVFLLLEMQQSLSD